jgi:hypothetical protein
MKNFKYQTKDMVKIVRCIFTGDMAYLHETYPVVDVNEHGVDIDVGTHDQFMSFEQIELVHRPEEVKA